MDHLILDNGHIRLELERSHGTIVRFVHADLGIDLVREPLLAENFRLLLPLPDWRGHYIRGRDQTLSEVEQPDHVNCTLRWRGLDSERGHFDIEVTQTIALEGDEATFTMAIENGSGHLVEEAHTVTLGGLANPEERHDWRLHYATGSGQGKEWPFYDTFPGSYLGPPEPVWSAMYHGALSMPWIDLYDTKRSRGVSISNRDTTTRQSLVWSELTPCTTYRGATGEQHWPDPAVTGGNPVGAALAWVSIPFVEPGTRWSGPPIVFRFHTGTWWTAARDFRTWYDTHTSFNKAGAWLVEEDAWQSTIISYPEGTIGYRFADLPAMARDAKQYGINVLQIDGWDIGGIDRDYPQYTPDPRLGTWEELRTALAECASLGVRVMLFTNLQVVSLETDWFAKELHRYAVRDPHQNLRGGMGWEYNTTLGLQNQTIHRMVAANPSRPEFAELILDQLDNVVRLGAPGTQLDKVNATGEIDFATDAPGARDSSFVRGMLDVLARFRRQARAEDPGFGIASEVHWDRAVPYVDASYSRFFSSDHLPTFAVAFPEYRQSCCITGNWDFGLVNNCVRFGHIINVEARCLHGTASDAPDLSAYVKEALRIRRTLRASIWESRLVEPATVQVDAPPALRWAVHEAWSDRIHAVVLNHFEPTTLTARIGTLSDRNAAVIHRPHEEPEHILLPADVTVPRDRFAAVVADPSS